MFPPLNNQRSIAGNNRLNQDTQSDMQGSSADLIQKSKKGKNVGRQKSTASLSKYDRSSDKDSKRTSKMGQVGMNAEQAQNAFAIRENKIGGVYNDNSDNDD